MKDFIVGIDIGTSSTRIVVCKEKEGSRKPQIVATATVPSRGLRHGYITQPAEVTQSVKDALAQVQKDIKQPIRHAYVGLGGISLGSYVHSTSLAISGGNSQVTQADIDRILEKGTEEITRDRKNIIVVHAFPIHYRIDNEEVLGTPLGMHGTQLHVKIIFITTLDLHYETLVRSVEKADIEVIDVIAAPLALSAVVMPHRHKTVGSLLLNIGAETTSLAVFEDGYLIDVSVVRFGSHDITNDLALGFKIDLEEAERVKKNPDHNPDIPKRKREEIINARLADIFELVVKRLEAIKRHKILPAGAVVLGGGAHIQNIESFTKDALDLPVRVLTDKHILEMTNRNIKDANMLTAYGLCVLALDEETYTSSYWSSGFFSSLKKFVDNFLEQFSP